MFRNKLNLNWNYRTKLKWFDIGKREVSSDIVSTEESSEESDNDIDLDSRDRRAIDEENDDNTMQELDMAQETNGEYRKDLER